MGLKIVLRRLSLRRPSNWAKFLLKLYNYNNFLVAYGKTQVRPQKFVEL